MGNRINTSTSANANTSINTNINNHLVENDSATKNKMECINLEILDDLGFDDLILQIQQMKPKNLYIDDDFKKYVTPVDIESMNLIPMAIELYIKMEKVIPDRKNNDKKFLYAKRRFFVYPRFGPEQIIDEEKEFDKNICQELENLHEIQEPKYKINTNNINVLEYVEAFQDPTSKKDMIGISKKILINCPNYHKVRFVNTYNRILNGQIMDKNICFGKASFIYKKPKNGPKDDINSFRKIIVIPTVVNHYHRILALRLTDYFNKNQYIDKTIQKGGINGTKNGILEQIYKVKNIIKHANENMNENNNPNLYLLFLDISNAFGNLNRKKLYEILEKYHVDKKFIDYLKFYYNNFKYYCKTKNWTTNNIKWNGGIIQGCPLSPILFVISLNYILTYLDNKYKEEFGYKINESTNILFTAFMDDICIMCRDLKKLEEMYNKIKFLFECIGLPINKNKTNIMIATNKNVKPNVGFDGIKITKSYKYLGEYLSCDGTTTESFSEFLSLLGKKLSAIDKKKIDNNTKIGFFSKCMLAWIQKKMSIMYDISKQDRIKIAAIIKKYLSKWGNKDSVKIFTFITDLMINSNDQVIKNSQFEKYIDNSIQYDADELHHILNSSDPNLEFSYDSINKEPDVDEI